MAKSKVQKKIEELTKRRKFLKKAGECSKMAMLLCGGMAVAATGIACVGKGAADMHLDKITDDVIFTQGYDNSIANKREMLLEDLNSGRITRKEYKTKLDALYSSESVLEYVEEKGNTDQKKRVSNYYDTKDFADTVGGKGIPTMLGFTGASLAGMCFSDYLRKKYERQIASLKRKQVTKKKATSKTSTDLPSSFESQFEMGQF